MCNGIKLVSVGFERVSRKKFQPDSFTSYAALVCILCYLAVNLVVSTFLRRISGQSVLELNHFLNTSC